MREIFHSKPWITAEDEAAVHAALVSGWLAQGTGVCRFEEKMSEWLNTSGAVAVGSGGAAIELALRALACGPGAEVVLPTYVCRTVLDAVITVGAQPVPCDVGSDWVVQAKDVAPHLTSHTRAIIVPHMYGIYADLPAIRKLGYPIIEDAAQALGSTAQHANQGDLVVLSFHPTKCITTGEGGMVLSRDPGLVAKCRLGRDANEHTFGRQFSPMSDIAATLGLSQLARYPEFLRRRQVIAQRYRETLSKIPGLDPEWLDRVNTMFFRFPLRRTGGLDQCQADFKRRGIHVRRGVDLLLHRLLEIPDAQFPSAMANFSTTVSLPIYPALGSTELENCLQAVTAVLGTNG
jgi:UDP-4-amino-4-deoxy-L-arabinose-oxoglutarate aminotransferase